MKKLMIMAMAMGIAGATLAEISIGYSGQLRTDTGDKLDSSR